MAARAQIEKVKLQELNFEDKGSTADESNTYVLLQSLRE